ncbi:hypothetical protein [Variovorax sp. Varisp62]|uniref:hypothetical protein n=1 Tax=Variovorax sp. Varisp62 TaxID=3243049 RepID=UPI0039B41A14
MKFSNRFISIRRVCFKPLFSLVIAASFTSSKAEFIQIIAPVNAGGMTTDMYIDATKVVYDTKNQLVKVLALSNVGDPPTISQRYTLSLSCDDGGQQITNRVVFTGPMATGVGQEIPDTADSLLKSYPAAGSIKGHLQAGLCKKLADRS